MLHKTTLVPVPGSDDLFKVYTTYTYTIKLPNYMKQCVMRNLSTPRERIRSQLETVSWRHCSEKKVEFSIKEITFIGQRIVVQLKVYSQAYDKAVEKKFKSYVDNVYRTERQTWRNVFVAFIIKNRISYRISRSLPERRIP